MKINYFSYQMVTGSADNSCMVWDLRIRRALKPIAAHTSLVSGLRVESKGQYIITSSFDNSLKVSVLKSHLGLLERK